MASSHEWDGRSTVQSLLGSGVFIALVGGFVLLLGAGGGTTAGVDLGYLFGMILLTVGSVFVAIAVIAIGVRLGVSD